MDDTAKTAAMTTATLIAGTLLVSI